MSKPIRILIVEDMATDVDLATRAIRKVLKDCEFEVAKNRKDFLRALEVFQPDVILSDYSLPHFDGMKAGANNYVLSDNLKRLGPAVIHALAEREALIRIIEGPLFDYEEAQPR